MARRKPYLFYEIQIVPRHQILARRSVYAGAKPFMKWTPGLKIQLDRYEEFDRRLYHFLGALYNTGL